MTNLGADLNDTDFLECLALITSEHRDQDGPPSSSEPMNHRVCGRKPATRTVTLAVRNGESGLGADLGAGLVDITQDGLGIRLKELVPVGQVVTIDLLVSGIGKPLRILAEVRWCRPCVDGTFRAGVCLRRRLSFPTVTGLTR